MEGDLHKAIYAYVAHLASTAEKGSEQEESLGVAVTLLKTGFRLEGEVAPSDALLKLYESAMSEQGGSGAAFPDLTKMLDPKMIEEAQKIFSGLGEGGAATARAADAASSSSSSASPTDTKPAAEEKPVRASAKTVESDKEVEWTDSMENLFQKFLKTITKNGFFLDEKPGSEGYKLRYERAKAKFKQKMAAKAKAKKSKRSKEKTSSGESGMVSAIASAAAVAAKATPPKVSPEEEAKQLKLANECKTEGNGLLGNGNHAAALRLYDRAIALLPVDKESSSVGALKAAAVYRSNRACALSNLGRHEEALASAEEAADLWVSLDSENIIAMHT